MEKIMHLVSIILPTYNRSAFLAEAIGSVLRQTYPYFELLVIDDGSSDDTGAVVRAVDDARLRYIRLEHTGIVSRVRNTGISHARGKLIAFLDSDDLWKETKLAEQVKVFDDFPEAGFSVTDVTTTSGRDILIPHTFFSEQRIVYTDLFPLMIGNRFLMYGSVLMVRRECLEKTGFYSETLRDGDLLLNMQLAYHFKAAIIYEPLTIRRLHEANTSGQMPLDCYFEYLYTFSWLYQHKMIRRRRWKQAKSLAHMKIGRLFREQGCLKDALYHYTCSLRNNLFYPRHVLLLMKTVFKN